MGAVLWAAAAVAFCLVAAPPSTGRISGGSTAASASFPGYWLVASDGGVYGFSAANLGSMRGHFLARPVVGGAATTDGLGYWLVASDGGIFSFGDAHFWGSTGNIALNEPIVGMASDPATGGYWMVASDGGVFSFHAPFFGSTGNMRLNKPIVGMVPTPTGRGYWLVASDGGVFSFGDARFYGSTGDITLNQPVVGIAAAPTGNGYWLVASDGGVFSFGGARFFGSTGNIRLNKPIVGMASNPAGAGYWLVASDGGMFAFGGAPFLGSTGADPGPAPIVAMMATGDGFPLPPGATGYDISFPQCGGPYPPPSRIAIVGVTGQLNGSANPCYASEAAWAGTNLSSYIFMNPLPNPPPAESLSGPAGVCNGNVLCESYNFAYYWVGHWVVYSRRLGINPTLWWLDIETGPYAYSDLSSSLWASHSQEVAGAVAALHAAGAVAGIYSTHYQWSQITGNEVAFPGIPLWEPGGGNVASGLYSSLNICAGQAGTNYLPFAGGATVLVQFGYVGNGYTGSPSAYDQDYACPA